MRDGLRTLSGMPSKLPMAGILACLVIPLLWSARAGSGAEGDAPGQRVQNGLLALYDSSQPEDSLIKDRAGAGEPVHLKIADPKSVRSSSDGLEIIGPTSIRSEQPASRIAAAIKQSGAVTLEAWVRPARTN